MQFLVLRLRAFGLRGNHGEGAGVSIERGTRGTHDSGDRNLPPRIGRIIELHELQSKLLERGYIGQYIGEYYRAH